MGRDTGKIATSTTYTRPKRNTKSELATSTLQAIEEAAEKQFKKRSAAKEKKKDITKKVTKLVSRKTSKTTKSRPERKRSTSRSRKVIDSPKGSISNDDLSPAKKITKKVDLKTSGSGDQKNAVKQVKKKHNAKVVANKDVSPKKVADREQTPKISKKKRDGIISQIEPVIPEPESQMAVESTPARSRGSSQKKRSPRKGLLNMQEAVPSDPSVSNSSVDHHPHPHMRPGDTVGPLKPRISRTPSPPPRRTPSSSPTPPTSPHQFPPLQVKISPSTPPPPPHPSSHPSTSPHVPAPATPGLVSGLQSYLSQPTPAAKISPSKMKTENELLYGSDIKRDDYYLYKTETPSTPSEDEEDDYEDPYLNMSIEELKERLPSYMFKTPEEKVVYFRELNENYFSEIELVKDGKDRAVKGQRRNVVFGKARRVRSNNTHFNNSLPQRVSLRRLETRWDL